MVIVAGANAGLRRIQRKVSATIAKDLGLKGRARYLRTKLDTSQIPEFANSPEKAYIPVFVRSGAGFSLRNALQVKGAHCVA